MAGKKAAGGSGNILMAGGLLLIVAALFLTGYNLWDERRAAESVARTLEEIGVEVPLPAEQGSAWSTLEEGEIPDYRLNPDMEMPTISVDGKEYIGVLEIPVIGLSLPIISQWSYPNLKLAPCRYQGSAYQDDLILAGHNYKSHFGGLKGLVPGDAVSFIDVDGNVFSYFVAEIEILKKTDVEEMEAGDWDLTLFTCTLGGQTRVTVRCQAAVD